MYHNSVSALIFRGSPSALVRRSLSPQTILALSAVVIVAAIAVAIFTLTRQRSGTVDNSDSKRK